MLVAHCSDPTHSFVLCSSDTMIRQFDSLCWQKKKKKKSIYYKWAKCYLSKSLWQLKSRLIFQPKSNHVKSNQFPCIIWFLRESQLLSLYMTYDNNVKRETWHLCVMQILKWSKSWQILLFPKTVSVSWR